MTKTRFRIPDIKGYQPAVEQRPRDTVVVTQSRNMAFDSKGPKSAFGCHRLAQGNFIEVERGFAQSITIANYTLVFTSLGVFRLRRDQQAWLPFTTKQIGGDGEEEVFAFHQLYDNIANKRTQKWTMAYLSNATIFCHPKFGIYRMQRNALLRRYQYQVPGLPKKPIANGECNGFHVIINNTHITWSNPGRPMVFTPQLGGAGQQVIAAKVSGDPFALACFQRGFLVWTTHGCMSGEFVGGDSVWRFSRVVNEVIPLGAHAVEQMADGQYLICSKLGLFTIDNGNEPQAITPLFNEMFREYAKDWKGLRVRLTYFLEYDQVFVCLENDTSNYIRTFVLNISLDKWGTFDEPHMGIIRYNSDRGSMGYVDHNGRAYKFVDHFPAMQNADGSLRGLNSLLEYGYIKPPEIHGSRPWEGEIDSVLEMHEIFIGGYPRRPTPPQVADAGVLDIPDEDCNALMRVANALSPTQILNNTLTDEGELETDNWTEERVNAVAVDLDNGKIYSIGIEAGDYSAYDQGKQTLQVIDGATRTFESKHNLGIPPGIPDYAARGTYDMWDEGLMFDRYTGWIYGTSVQENHDGSVDWVYKPETDTVETVLYTIWNDEFEEADEGLGQYNGFIGVTEDYLILMHQIYRNKSFKIEVLDKSDWSRVRQYQFRDENNSDFVGDESWEEWSRGINTCITPNGWVWNFQNLRLNAGVANIEADQLLILSRYNYNTNAYERVTPWTEGEDWYAEPEVIIRPDDYPIVIDRGSNNMECYAMWYDRVTEKLVLVLKVNSPITNNPFFEPGTYDPEIFYINSYGNFFWGTVDPVTLAWVYKGRFPQTGLFDADGEETNLAGAAFYVPHIGIPNLRDMNRDSLPFSAPKLQMLNTTEMVWKVEAGITNKDWAQLFEDIFVPSVVGNPSKAYGQMSIRDPEQDYKVIDQHNDGGNHFQAILNNITVRADNTKFNVLKDLVIERNDVVGFVFNGQAYDVPFAFMPNGDYVSLKSSQNFDEISSYAFATQSPEANNYNWEFSSYFVFVNPCIPV